MIRHSGAAQGAEAGTHNRQHRKKRRNGPVAFVLCRWRLWVPGSRFASPGMTGGVYVTARSAKASEKGTVRAT
jgi:hypothetical protein